MRWLQGHSFTRNETAEATTYDYTGIIENILVILPDTTRVVVVPGSSPLENFWRDEFSREFARFNGRLEFEWFNDLSLEQTLARTSALPPHSAIFYPMFSVDGAGVAQSEDQVLAQLHATSNAPLFGLYEVQLGRGVGGGPMSPLTDGITDHRHGSCRY